jgi:hypothetical protein
MTRGLLCFMGVRSNDPLNGPVSTQVAVLASALRGRAPELAGQLTGRIIERIDSYAEGGPVPREDLYESCRESLEYRIRGFTSGEGALMSRPTRSV